MMKKLFALCLMLIFSAIVLLIAFGDPRIYINNRKLVKALAAEPDGNTALVDVVPFRWDQVWIFSSDATKKEIVDTIFMDIPAIHDGSHSAGGIIMVFSTEGNVTACCKLSGEENGVSVGVDLHDSIVGYASGNVYYAESTDRLPVTVAHSGGCALLTITGDL